MRKILGILATIIAIIIFYVFIFTSPVDKLINSGIDYVAQEDTEALMDLVSRDFKGPDGTGYDDIPEILDAIFETFDHIKVIIEKKEEEIIEKNREVLVKIKFKIIANIDEQRFYVFGSPMNTKYLEIGVRKEKGGWKIISSSRYPASKDQLKNLKTYF